MLKIIFSSHLTICIFFSIHFSCFQADKNTNNKPKLTGQTGKEIRPANIKAPLHYFIKDIGLPESYSRIDAAGEMTTFCRNLELQPDKSKVFLYNGELKDNQSAHFAILKLDVGQKDLQQCADAVMRIRAEYLFANQRFSDIHFNFTSGDNCDWIKWQQGWRPKITGNTVSWKKTKPANDSYTNFTQYLQMVFTYAGSASLSKELKKTAYHNMQIGDVFIQGEFPGHAVIVVDMVQNSSGEKLYMLAQSYMPAQDIHVLVNPANKKISPWYELDSNQTEVVTPEWIFKTTDLKKF